MKNYFLSIGLICYFIFSAETVLADTITQERYNKICKWGIFNPPECKKYIIKATSKKKTNSQNSSQKSGEEQRDVEGKKNSKAKAKLDRDCRFGIFNPPKCKGRDKRYKNKPAIEDSNSKISELNSDKQSHNVSFYTGTFDLIDKEGDDQTTMFGVEHKNEDLFRNTWLGKFSPTTGMFMTGKSSLYLYSGVETDYNIGPLSFTPSFAPGFYEKGGGKDLGSVVEFKSELKIGLDIFENSKIGYSYSHISNNDWGTTNPGTDNQQITYSKNF